MSKRISGALGTLELALGTLEWAFDILDGRFDINNTVNLYFTSDKKNTFIYFDTFKPHWYILPTFIHLTNSYIQLTHTFNYLINSPEYSPYL